MIFISNTIRTLESQMPKFTTKISGPTILAVCRSHGSVLYIKTIVWWCLIHMNYQQLRQSQPRVH